MSSYINDNQDILSKAILEADYLSETEMEEDEASRYLVLVLNADDEPIKFLPLRLWTFQEALTAYFCEEVDIVDVYPDATTRISGGNGLRIIPDRYREYPLPSVVALTEYVRPKKKKPAFTRRNVFLRDEYKCQFCNGQFRIPDLTLDHLNPRCDGGKLTWENAVTSCLECNGKKGPMSVDELPEIGMRLIRKPKRPTQRELEAIAVRLVLGRLVHPTWKYYLGIKH